MRALLADDQPAFTMALTMILGLDGIEVVGTAIDGHEAITLARHTRPDLALLDIRMPVLDGLAACRQITAEGTAGTVMVLSGSSSDADRKLAHEAGASGYIVKDDLISIAAMVADMREKV